ncbi:MAG: MarR family transcriptional regulator [Nanoarchaeota archaeon]|nr:MarR family transcriptional regulator [Nanoarchaeota archaeon]
MNQKQIGIIIIILGVLLTMFTYVVKIKEDNSINFIVQQQGSCFLDDGTCLHADRDYSLYVFGFILSAALIILGFYLIFFDKTQEILAKHQIEVSSALKEAKKNDGEKGKFDAFLSGFNKDEQTVLRAIKEQEGIKQATLRYKIGMSKTGLSLTLKSLEERGIISRKPSGKTNEVFLRNFN